MRSGHDWKTKSNLWQSNNKYRKFIAFRAHKRETQLLGVTTQLLEVKGAYGSCWASKKVKETSRRRAPAQNKGKDVDIGLNNTNRSVGSLFGVWWWQGREPVVGGVAHVSSWVHVGVDIEKEPHAWQCV